jgi:hypothetical protein
MENFDNVPVEKEMHKINRFDLNSVLPKFSCELYGTSHV